MENQSALFSPAGGSSFSVTVTKTNTTYRSKALRAAEYWWSLYEQTSYLAVRQEQVRDVPITGGGELQRVLQLPTKYNGASAVLRPHLRRLAAGTTFNYHLPCLKGLRHPLDSLITEKINLR